MPDNRNIEGGIIVKWTELWSSNGGKQMEKEIKWRQQKSKLNTKLSFTDEKSWKKDDVIHFQQRKPVSLCVMYLRRQL